MSDEKYPSAKHDWKRHSPSNQWSCRRCEVMGGNLEAPGDVGPCPGVAPTRDFCAPPPAEPSAEAIAEALHARLVICRDLTEEAQADCQAMQDARQFLIARAHEAEKVREAAEELARRVFAMHDDWSESSEAHKRDLWRAVHRANNDLFVALAPTTEAGR